MATIEPSLFDWRDVQARSDLDRFDLARDHLPDARLLQDLEVMRGSGRDDYPVAAMWSALIAGVVFQHPSVEALLRELARNPALMQACGFAVLPIQRKPVTRLVRDPATGRLQPVREAPADPQAAVPTSWSFSRFLANVIELEETLGMVTEMIGILREQLMAALPDFGCHLGYDGKAIESHSTGRVSRSAVRDRGGCRRAASASGRYGRPSGDAGCRHSSILLKVVVWRGKRRSSGRFIKRCWSA